VITLLYTRAISERFRDKELIIKRYINLPSFFTLYNSISNRLSISVFGKLTLPVYILLDNRYTAPLYVDVDIYVVRC